MSGIEYALKDIDGNIFKLNDITVSNPVKGSFTIGPDDFIFDNRIVDNSALPGSVQLGTRRLMARDIVLSFSRAVGSDYTTFQSEENSLIQFLQKTVYLLDETNERQVPVAIEGYTVAYDPGSYLLSSNNEIALKLLEPFWTSTSVSNTATALIIGINTIAIGSLGSLAIPPIITFTASVAVASLQVYVDENKRGIQIEDTIFGTSTFTTMILDCEEGTLTIGTLDRVNSILAGTGFFEFPIGSSTLKVIPDAICSISIDRYERKYV